MSADAPTAVHVRRLRQVAALLIAGLAALLWPIAESASAGRVWVVAPDGSADGDGSAQAPLDLGTVLGPGSPLGPGDTVELEGGRYAGCLTSTISGSATQPIIVRQQSNEAAVVDGAGCREGAVLTVEGNHVWFLGFEVTNSDPDRMSDYEGSNPPDRRANGINVYGDDVKLINLVVHDNGNGLGLWSQAQNTEIYGVVTYNNGWDATDRAHGHGIYVQNDSGVKSFEDVVSIGNYSMGVQAYASAGTVRGLRFDRLVVANNGAPANPSGPVRERNLFLGSGNPIADVEVNSSHFYQPAGSVGGGVTLGYGSTINESVRARNNIIANGAQSISVRNFRTAELTGNQIYATPSGNPTSNAELMVAVPPAGIAHSYTFDNNTYTDGTNSDSPFAYANQAHNWASWRTATNGDADSTYRTGTPTDTQTYVLPNKYQPGRATIAIYNWANQPSTTIDPSQAGLTPGQPYEIRLAQGFHQGPIATGTANGPITIPLTNQPAPPTGTTHNLTTQFHTLIIQPTGPAPTATGPAKADVSSSGAEPPGDQVPATGQDQTGTVVPPPTGIADTDARNDEHLEESDEDSARAAESSGHGSAEASAAPDGDGRSGNRLLVATAVVLLALAWTSVLLHRPLSVLRRSR